MENQYHLSQIEANNKCNESKTTQKSYLLARQYLLRLEACVLLHKGVLFSQSPSLCPPTSLQVLFHLFSLLSAPGD